MEPTYNKTSRTLWASIPKAEVEEDIGLRLRQNDKGHIIIDKVFGHCRRHTPIEHGCRLMKFQDKPVESYTGGLDEINRLIREEMKIMLEVLKPLEEMEFDKNRLHNACVIKTHVEEKNAGLVLKQGDDDGHIYVEKVEGLFSTYTKVEAGSRLLQIQHKPVESFPGGLDEINQLLQDEMKIEVQILKPESKKPMEIPADAFPMEPGQVLKMKDGTVVKIKKASTKPGRWLVQVSSSGAKKIVDSKDFNEPETGEDLDWREKGE